MMKLYFARNCHVILQSMHCRSVINFREAYNMFACNGILFNHESPRRGETFVTRKVRFCLSNCLSIIEEKDMSRFEFQITRSVAKISLGQLECFELGNLDSQVRMVVLKLRAICIYRETQRQLPLLYFKTSF